MKSNNSKKIIIFLLSLILLLYGMLVVISGYFGYINTFILKDSEETNIIRNVLKSHDKKISHLNLLKSEYNLAIESFGGTERVVYDKDNKDIISKNDSVVKKYEQYYKMDKNNKVFNNEEDLNNYISEKYRYYNEDMLEIYLLFYKRYTGNELAVEEIKSYVNDGNTENQDEIWNYIDWFAKGSIRKGLLECRLKDSKDKNNSIKFDYLNLEEKKEFIKALDDSNK